MQVVSEFGADGQGRVTIHDLQNVYYGNMRARFTAFNVHGAGDASLSEVYFYIGSEEVTNSFFTRLFLVFHTCCGLCENFD